MKLFRSGLLSAVLAAFTWLAVPAASAQTALPHAQVGAAYSFQVTTTPAAPAGTLYSATGLPLGLSINAASGLISGMPAAAGTSTPTISLTSGAVTNRFTVTLIVDPAAGTPAITSGASATTTVGQAFSYTVTASNSPTSFNVGALPAGLAFASPTITGTPTTAGTYAIALSANNANGTGGVKTLTLTVAPAGPVPVITSATSAAAALNAAFAYQIQASNTPVSYFAVGLPLGLTLNGATGAIAGTPTVPGVYTVALSAANANGTGAATNLTLTVGALPAITSAATASFTQNQAASFQLTASNAPLSFNVTGLPPGLSVSAAGRISGSPTTVGTFTVTVSANNATGTGPSATLNVIVSAAAGGGGSGGGGGGGGGNTGGSTTTAPVFTQHPTSVSVTAGSTVTLTGAAAGTAPIAYQWRKDGAAISGATAATLSFTAGVTDAGSYTLAATNPAGTAVSNPATVAVTAIVTTAPVITTSPRSQTAGVGASVTLTVAATGSDLSYQWTKDGVALAGATNATLTLPAVAATTTGRYAVTVTNSAGAATSGSAVVAVLPTNAQVMNVSTRGVVGTGEKVLIAGFVVTGSDPKPVLIRAVGPGLTAYGVAGVVSDPVLELRDSASQVVASNDNWGGATNAAAIVGASARVGAFALAAGSADAAILTTLSPGLYTATVRGAGTSTGVGLVEVYDASEDVQTSRLVNVSSRADVGTDGNVLIAGFVVSGTDPKRVLIRAAGPALGRFGVEAALGDTKLQVYRDGAVVVENDDWGTATNASDLTAAAVDAGAFAFSAGSRDSAVLVTLPPGNYSAVVSGAGAGGATGAALVEVYEVP